MPELVPANSLFAPVGPFQGIKLFPSAAIPVAQFAAPPRTSQYVGRGNTLSRRTASIGFISARASLAFHPPTGAGTDLVALIDPVRLSRAVTGIRRGSCWTAVLMGGWCS